MTMVEDERSRWRPEQVRATWYVFGPKPFGGMRCMGEHDAREVCDELNRIYSPELALKSQPPTAEQVERMLTEVRRAPILVLDRRFDDHESKISADWDALISRAMERNEPSVTVRQHIRYEIAGEIIFTHVREATLVKDADGFHLEERRPEWYGPARVG